MKKLLLLIILFVLGSGFSFGQTTILEQYFHELKGMEDSTGVTHLFYRHLKDVKNTISSCGDRTQTFHYKTDNIFHQSPASSVDSLKFRSFFGDSCIGYGDSFYDNDPSKWLINISYDYMPVPTDYLGNSLNFQIPIPIKTTNQDDRLSYLPDEILLSPNYDSLFVTTSSNITIPFPGNGDNWPEFETYEAFQTYADSLAFTQQLVAIHPSIDSLYFGVNGTGHLYRSEHYSQDFVVADSAHHIQNLFFDADTTHIYSVYSSGLLRSNDLGKQGSWTFIDLNYTKKAPRYFTLDSSTSGHLFISDFTNIMFSNNYGDTFTSLISVDNEITGLYKKPDSNLLYVLTKKELLQLNIDTKEVTTLKKLSVSNETEPSQIPKKITLEQNYPNPFNPSTKIQYQLPESALVRLEVFDVTGRKVAVLVNGEPQLVGTHQVTFDAGNLASGMYFYRVQSGGQTITQKMMLLK